jgi:hypothetical protein
VTPAIAKKYQTYADAISGAPAYEKTNAFRLFARSVAGMIEPVDFPRAEASDRLRDKAQALGLLMNQTEDDIQREIAEAFDNPIPDDGTVGELMAPAKQSNQSVHKLVTYCDWKADIDCGGARTRKVSVVNNHCCRDHHRRHLAQP